MHAPWKKSRDQLRQHIKKQRHHFAEKVHIVKAMFFPVLMYRCVLDRKEGWVPKNWCLWTVVLEKTLESSLDCKEIQPVHPKGNQSWIFSGRTSILCPPGVKNWLLGKDPDAGRDWRQEEKGTTEDEMVGWHYHINRHSLNSSRIQWRTGRPGMLQSMGSGRAGHDWTAEQQQSSLLP